MNWRGCASGTGTRRYEYFLRMIVLVLCSRSEERRVGSDWSQTCALPILKVPMPHMEAEHELEGLRFWNGDPTVRVLFADDRTGAMLLERCEPGTPLRELPESDQDVCSSDRKS